MTEYDKRNLDAENLRNVARANADLVTEKVLEKELSEIRDAAADFVHQVNKRLDALDGAVKAVAASAKKK